MKKAVLNSMTVAERRLVEETEKKNLAELDEDALLALHTRIRRQRTKYVGMYRRQAAGRVGDAGGRGAAFAQNQRNRDKAEVFEKALARVSHQVEVVARQAAAELKADRIAAARSDGFGPDQGAPGEPGAHQRSGKARKHAKTTGGKKRDASTRAQGKRRQAKRDAR